MDPEAKLWQLNGIKAQPRMPIAEMTEILQFRS